MIRIATEHEVAALQAVLPSAIGVDRIDDVPGFTAYVRDDYISDGPGYAGPVAIVHWGGGPGFLHAFIQCDGKWVAAGDEA